jgi:hypothetical protein
MVPHLRTLERRRPLRTAFPETGDVDRRWQARRQQHRTAQDGKPAIKPRTRCGAMAPGAVKDARGKTVMKHGGRSYIGAENRTFERWWEDAACVLMPAGAGKNRNRQSGGDGEMLGTELSKNLLADSISLRRIEMPAKFEERPRIEGSRGFKSRSLRHRVRRLRHSPEHVRSFTRHPGVKSLTWPVGRRSDVPLSNRISGSGLPTGRTAAMCS